MSKPVAEMSLLKADQLCMQAGMGRARRDVVRNIAILCAVATLSACSSQPGGRLVWLDKPQDKRALAGESKTIADLRAANYQAMVARNLDRTMSIVGEHYVIVAGNSSIRRSSAEMRGRWTSAFADPTWKACVRKPDKIEVGQNAGVLRAAERGQWQCPRTTSADETIAHGSYFAHWKKSAGIWTVVSDNYVPLGCSGKECVR
jgi:hypothetical protein